MEIIMNAITTTIVTVPNGTQTADSMAKLFKCYAKKTAESILQMAKVVSDMKARKNKPEFEKFCDLIGYKSDSSPIRKFTQIGEKFDQLNANVDKLPNTWTTVYQIALMTKETIEDLIDTGVITPQISGAEAKNVLRLFTGKTATISSTKCSSTPERTDAEMTFRARLPAFPSVEAQKKLKRILAELEELNCEVEISSGLDAAIAEPMLALAA
jgi:hypothetical protein